MKLTTMKKFCSWTRVEGVPLRLIIFVIVKNKERKKQKNMSQLFGKRKRSKDSNPKAPHDELEAVVDVVDEDNNNSACTMKPMDDGGTGGMLMTMM